MRPFKIHKLAWLICLGGLSILGTLLIKETTSLGAGLRPDSHTYFSAAEMIVNGQGYVRASGPYEVRPVTNFPPLYAYSLATIHMFGLDVYPSARVLSGILFGLSIGALGIALQLATGSYYWSLYGMLLFLSSPVFIELYSYALSEPLYLFLSISAFILLSFYMSIQKSPWIFVATGIVFGGVFLTRFIGISALIAGLLIIWAKSRKGPNWEKRNFPIIIFSLLSGLPMLLYIIRNAVVASNLTNRPAPYWHPPGLEMWITARDAILGWLMPPSWVQLVAPMNGWIICIFILAAFLVYMSMNYLRPARITIATSFNETFTQIQSTYFVAYIFLLLASVFLFDILTPLNNRLLSPLLLTSLTVMVIIFSTRWNKAGKQIRIVIISLAVYLIGNQVYQARELISYLADTPQGYASSLYRSSPTIEYLKQFPNKIVYSNDLPALYFWASLDAIFIPSPFNPYAREENTEDKYSIALSEMRNNLVQKDALLVILGSNPRGRLEHEHWVELTDGLKVIIEFADGIIFGYQENEG